jgi:uncharacterized alkaline shock family protein YloU
VSETQTSGRSPLQSERGTTTIQDAVVTSVAGLAVDEVSGAEQEVPGRQLPGDTSPTMGELFGRVTGSGRGARGVSVEVGETQAAIDLTVTVPYGRSIPEVTKTMRDTVIQHVENLTRRKPHRTRSHRGRHHRQGRLFPPAVAKEVS